VTSKAGEKSAIDQRDAAPPADGAPVSAAPAAGTAGVPADGAPVIEVSRLSKVFGTRKALNEVDFSLPSGAFLSIFGPNGAGKTTLLRVLSTLAHASSGSAKLFGLDSRAQADAIRQDIGFISHRSMLYLDLTAEENLFFAARLYGIDDAEARVAQMLAAVELTGRRHDAVRTFSRGMTQRLAIARALIHSPRLLFLDEPYSGLDPHASEILDGLIARVREQHSFVMVSHDLQKGYDLSTHLLVLAKGRSVFFGARATLGFDEFVSRYHEVVGGNGREVGSGESGESGEKAGREASGGGA
jgi:heme exporter protein A